VTSAPPVVGRAPHGPKPDDTVGWILRRHALDADHGMAAHARSFSFASALLSPGERRAVEEIYAFCRATDDLVDEPPGDAHPHALLDAWEAAARASYDGSPSGLRVIDRAMRRASLDQVPWSRIAALFEGMRMDLRGASYVTIDDLQRYAHRVAGVVGLWLARAHGVERAEDLARADALGRAMQLTNIVRDVGEDLRRGRLYLPRRAMAAHGVTVAGLLDGLSGGTIPSGYPALLEMLMRAAERDYRTGLEGLPALPPGFGRAVAVAAGVYRGIHREVRRDGYDNLTRRSATSLPTKVVIAGRMLLRTAGVVGVSRRAAAPPALPHR
jgi:phytoene synthase